MSIDAKSADVAARLRQLQAKHNLTIQEMADRCGMPKRSLENYMKLKEPQRPGVDALIGIADGMGVSIDWIVGRSDLSSTSDFTVDDYAFLCQSTVLHVLVRILDAVRDNPAGAINTEARLIMGYEAHEIAAVAMLDFLAAVDLQADHPSRPKDYFKRHVATLSDFAAREVKAASVYELKDRKPETR